MANEQAPDINIAAAHAAWALTQALALELIRTETIEKRYLREALEKAIQYHQTAPGLGQSQRAASRLLAQFHTLLQTADRRDSN